MFEHLADHKEYLDNVIEWLWKEFGNEDNYGFWESIVKNSLRKNQLPLTFIALMDNQLVGTVGLWRSDLLSRQDLYPWLSALFVKEQYRGKNIGQELQRFLIDYCREKGYEELFLYTDICNYYEKTGWQYLDDGIEYSGESIKIYKKELSE
ncbi:GNAT family N-acetyltransferase [Clostridium cellulovorans]|uniref:GCN5-related N-acetyltransferase n=1 Tax=Clostridium cellulovorans (strain ATCC 35296 / DSM 3052 / OCM 3 / 743B) TaxID=573061 RepID=D9STX8_CLOC7|nr:GNAT family N-acetyltransferase [Clostridium cellulovorans]ADL50816.1 GCN5-related N-acetyltransferase [Clostridium cellulovorans 743B]